MNPFIAEFLGTAVLILLGNGVVANVLLHKTKGNNSGLIVITIGWAIAVYAGVNIATASGAHLNPAVTIADAVNSNDWSKVITYIPAQLLGAMLGSFLVWVSYKNHYDETTDSDLIQATFCTSPAINNAIYNFITECLGAFILMFAVLFFTKNSQGVNLGAINALPVALIVLGIGLSLGGPTGYAINPARDLGPRIMHFILPIKNKKDSGWKYSWLPVVAPIVGAMLAVVLFKAVV